MRQIDKERPSLGGSYESFNSGDDVLSDDASSSSVKRELTDPDQNVKRSRDDMYGEVSTHLFSQTISPISFFAKAEEAQLKAVRETGNEQVGLQTNVNSLNITENKFGLLSQPSNTSVNFFKSAKESIPLAFNPALRFRDGSIPITYKENNPVNLKIMKIRETFLQPLSGSLILEDGYLPNSDYEGYILVACFDNKWVLKNVATDEIKSPETGKLYAFVTMPDKTIRIAEAEKRAHCHNSGASPVVRYAGNVRFDEQGEIIEWDNSSGSYQPAADLAHQAGFGEVNMPKFRRYTPPAEHTDISVATAAAISAIQSIIR